MIDRDKDSIILTPETIARVREGVAAAQNPTIRQTIQKALSQLSMADSDVAPSHLSGMIRRLCLRLITHSLFDISVENRQAFPERPAIVVCNHLNHFDPLILLAEIPAQPFYYVLGDSRTLYNKCWKRFVLHFAGGVIPVERLWREELALLKAFAAENLGNPQYKDLSRLAAMVLKDVPDGKSLHRLKQIRRASLAALERGDGVIVFAEGRLGRKEGTLQLPLKRGTALYALRAGVPIVPVSLTGVRNLHLRKRLTVRFGQPLQVDRHVSPKRGEIDALMREIEHGLNALLEKDYCEPSGIKPLRYCLNHLLL